MKYLLDTDVCIDLIRRKPGAVLARIRALELGDLSISSITLAELGYGVARSREPERNQEALLMFAAPLEVMDFDATAAEVYGSLRADLAARGLPIGPLDTLIAAQAVSLGVTLVTNNAKEFQRVPGLQVADWTLDEPAS